MNKVHNLLYQFFPQLFESFVLGNIYFPCYFLTKTYKAGNPCPPLQPLCS